MSQLLCPACSPAEALNRPFLVDGRWRAACPACLATHDLLPDTDNVFLPVRFRFAASAPVATARGRSPALP